MRLIAALLSLVAVPLLATLSVEPQLADVHTSVRVVVSGTSGGGGAPSFDHLEISGHTITVHMHDPQSGISAPLSYRAVVNLGLLDAGVYEVVVYYNEYRGESATLIVRDDTLFTSRHLLPISGGDVYVGDNAETSASLSIDGGPPLPLDRKSFTFHVPPHAAGTVDARVVTESGKTITARALLTFFDPAAPPEPALFEPILFPIAFSGPGALGTQWSAANKVVAVRSPTWFRQPLPCAACSDVLQYGGATLDSAGAAGQLLYVERGGVANLWLVSRVREATRGAVTPVPVFLEGDLRDDGANFLDVPVLPNARATVRVWALAGGDSMSVAAIVYGERGLDAVYASMTRSAPDAPWFTTFDLTQSMAKVAKLGPADAPQRIEIRTRTEGRVWALLSMTDNDTQQPILFTPQ